MPSDLIRGWIPVRVKKRQNNIQPRLRASRSSICAILSRSSHSSSFLSFLQFERRPDVGRWIADAGKGSGGRCVSSPDPEPRLDAPRAECRSDCVDACRQPGTPRLRSGPQPTARRQSRRATSPPSRTVLPSKHPRPRAEPRLAAQRRTVGGAACSACTSAGGLAGAGCGGGATGEFALNCNCWGQRDATTDVSILASAGFAGGALSIVAAVAAAGIVRYWAICPDRCPRVAGAVRRGHWRPNPASACPAPAKPAGRRLTNSTARFAHHLPRADTSNGGSRDARCGSTNGCHQASHSLAREGIGRLRARASRSARRSGGRRRKGRR